MRERHRQPALSSDEQRLLPALAREYAAARGFVNTGWCDTATVDAARLSPPPPPPPPAPPTPLHQRKRAAAAARSVGCRAPALLPLPGVFYLRPASSAAAAASVAPASFALCPASQPQPSVAARRTCTPQRRGGGGCGVSVDAFSTDAASWLFVRGDGGGDGGRALQAAAAASPLRLAAAPPPSEAAAAATSDDDELAPFVQEMREEVAKTSALMLEKGYEDWHGRVKGSVSAGLTQVRRLAVSVFEAVLSTDGAGARALRAADVLAAVGGGAGGGGRLLRALLEHVDCAGEEGVTVDGLALWALRHETVSALHAVLRLCADRRSRLSLCVPPPTDRSGVGGGVVEDDETVDEVCYGVDDEATPAGGRGGGRLFGSLSHSLPQPPRQRRRQQQQQQPRRRQPPFSGGSSSCSKSARSTAHDRMAWNESQRRAQPAPPCYVRKQHAASPPRRPPPPPPPLPASSSLTPRGDESAAPSAAASDGGPARRVSVSSGAVVRAKRRSGGSIRYGERRLCSILKESRRDAAIASVALAAAAAAAEAAATVEAAAAAAAQGTVAAVGPELDAAAALILRQVAGDRVLFDALRQDFSAHPLAPSQHQRGQEGGVGGGGGGGGPACSGTGRPVTYSTLHPPEVRVVDPAAHPALLPLYFHCVEAPT